MISVVIPTIDGREESLERTLAAYEQLKDYELIVIRNAANWPTACNEGYRLSKGDVIHFGADDLEPTEGFLDDALPWLEDHDELPAAKVLNYSLDGEFDNKADGADGSLVWFTRVPLMRRDQYERIGPWPEIDYYADIWLSNRGRRVDIPTRMFYSYCFIHHWSPIGRLDSERNLKRAWRQYEAAIE